MTILTPRDPPVERQHKICSRCNGKLDWLESSRKFICYPGGLSYNELCDKPLSSVDQAIQPLQGEGREEPVFVSIQRNKRLQGEYQSQTIEEVRSLGNGRVKHIQLKPGLSPAAYNMHNEEE